jgi:acyl carrier protein
MTMQNNFEIIQEILVDTLAVEPSEVNPGANVRDDLGADSLDTTEVLMNIENKMQISIPDDFEYHIVQDLVDHLDELDRRK